MKPGPELDKLVCKAVGIPHGVCNGVCYPRVSQGVMDIRQYEQIMKWLGKGGTFWITSPCESTGWKWVATMDRVHDVSADTMTECVCLAVAAIVGSQRESPSDYEQLEIGKVYQLRHSRKGKCTFRVDSFMSIDDDRDAWVEGMVVSGHLQGIGVGSYRGPGDYETVRWSLCTFVRGIHLTPPTTTCSGPPCSARHTCTTQDPWKPGMGRAEHPDAIATGPQQNGWPSGDVQSYKCPHCGLCFEEELPQ